MTDTPRSSQAQVACTVGHTNGETEVGPRRSMAAQLIRYCQIVFAPIAIAFLLYFAWQSRGEIQRIVAGADIRWLTAAAALWSLMHVLAPLFAKIVFQSRGYPVSYRTAARIHADNLPARYLPGGIWNSVGRVIQYRALDIGRSALSAFVLLENALAFFVALLLGLACLTAANGFERVQFFGLMGGCVCVLALLALPRVLRARFLNGESRPTASAYPAIALLVAASWSIAAGSFVCFYASFASGTSEVPILTIAGSYLVAWAIGFVAIFAPQGVGVFEYVAADLLQGGRSIEATAVLIAGFRLIVLAVDTAVWLLSRVDFRVK